MKHLRVLPGCGLALLAAGVLVSPVAAEPRIPLPTIVQGKGDKCVEPTHVIRERHMDFLLHQRDDTMHAGIRTTRHSLVECIECHAVKDDKGDYTPVDAPGQFCNSCHSYTAVSMDCFQCHATTPDSGSEQGAKQP